MPFSLVRKSDGAGDSGPMSRRIWPDGHEDKDPKPVVGAAIMVGSIYARTFSIQDYWRTTIVTEILEDSGNYVRFKTQNSEYEWERF